MNTQELLKSHSLEEMEVIPDQTPKDLLEKQQAKTGEGIRGDFVNNESGSQTQNQQKIKTHDQKVLQTSDNKQELSQDPLLESQVELPSQQFVEEEGSSNDIENFKKYQNDDDDSQLESCFNGRYIKHKELISDSKYRTITRGYDNDSGCEIAWCVYSLENTSKDDKAKILQVLEQVRLIKHQNILTCIHYLVKEKELVLITELITAGSIREYLKKIKLPRLIVIKNWCLKILEGVHYLHQQGFIHGKLTCESIYINSNNGDIKIGDLGIRAIPSYNNKYSELCQCELLKHEQKTDKFDVFCVGLAILEMISSDMSGPQAFKYLCRIINKGGKQQILENIIDEKLRDFISKALAEEPDKRSTIEELLSHPFLEKSENDHDSIKLSSNLTNLINKHYSRKKQMINSSSIQESLASISNQDMTAQNTARHKKKHKNVGVKHHRHHIHSHAHSKITSKQTSPTGSASEPQYKSHLHLKTDQQISNSNHSKDVVLQQEQSIKDNTTQVQEQESEQKDASNQIQLSLKVIKLRIRVASANRLLEVSFDYNLESDTPDKIAQEMKKDLLLQDQEIDKIQRDIEKIVTQVQTQKESPETNKGSKRQSQSRRSDKGKSGTLNLFQLRKTSNNSGKPLITRSRGSSSLVKHGLAPAEGKNAQSPNMEQVDEYQQDPFCNDNGSSDKEERNPACEEVVVMGDPQDKANQTMDEIYQNTEDNPIKCNVVTNQLNFLNSIVYRDKVDFNNSIQDNHRSARKYTKAKSTLFKQKEHHDSLEEEKGSQSNEISVNRDTEELKDLLQQLFPNYHLYYCADRSTWNPIIGNANLINFNDTFDLSMNSIDYANALNNHRLQHENHIHSPFNVEDCSVIHEPAQIPRINQDSKYDNIPHIPCNEIHHEIFTEGLSSLLFFDKKSTFPIGGIHNTSTSNSSDSHILNFKNSLRNKRPLISENEIEQSSTNLNEKLSNHEQIQQNTAAESQNTKDQDKPEHDEVLKTPNFITPKIVDQPEIHDDKEHCFSSAINVRTSNRDFHHYDQLLKHPFDQFDRQQSQDVITQSHTQQKSFIVEGQINSCHHDQKQAAYEDSYFEFDQNSPLDEMRSNKLHRGFKQMFKRDIIVLKQAFNKIFGAQFERSDGHFCSKTQQLVKKFQKMYNFDVTGVVDQGLFKLIISNYQSIIIHYQDETLHKKGLEEVPQSSEETITGFDSQSQIFSPPGAIHSRDSECMKEESQVEVQIPILQIETCEQQEPFNY